jgi:hypothetical protein
LYIYRISERPRRPGYYSYTIINNDIVEVVQVYKPGEEGTVDMTQEVASAVASGIVYLKNNPPEPAYTIWIRPTPTSIDKATIKSYIESLGYTTGNTR